MGFVFKVKNGEVPPMPEHLSPEGKDFICSCLKLDPRARPTAAELLQHPFVANAFDNSIPHSPLSPHERAQSPSSLGHVEILHLPITSLEMALMVVYLSLCTHKYIHIIPWRGSNDSPIYVTCMATDTWLLSKKGFCVIICHVFLEV